MAILSESFDLLKEFKFLSETYFLFTQLTSEQRTWILNDHLDSSNLFDLFVNYFVPLANRVVTDKLIPVDKIALTDVVSMNCGKHENWVIELIYPHLIMFTLFVICLLTAAQQASRFSDQTKLVTGYLIKTRIFQVKVAALACHSDRVHSGPFLVMGIGVSRDRENENPCSTHHIPRRRFFAQGPQVMALLNFIYIFCTDAVHTHEPLHNSACVRLSKLGRLSSQFLAMWPIWFTSLHMCFTVIHPPTHRTPN